MELKNIWVIEYSPTQDALHRQPLLKAIKCNNENFKKRNGNAWMPIAVGTDDETFELAPKLAKKLYEQKTQKDNF